MLLQVCGVCATGNANEWGPVETRSVFSDPQWVPPVRIHGRSHCLPVRSARHSASFSTLSVTPIGLRDSGESSRLSTGRSIR